MIVVAHLILNSLVNEVLWPLFSDEAQKEQVSCPRLYSERRQLGSSHLLYHCPMAVSYMLQGSQTQSWVPFQETILFACGKAAWEFSIQGTEAHSENLTLWPKNCVSRRFLLAFSDGGSSSGFSSDDPKTILGSQNGFQLPYGMHLLVWPGLAGAAYPTFQPFAYSDH